ncbi:hypothetical protein SDC9_165406 [bioreactor metagenome]|uniref:Uncharacterized protein n=1 Tax=bioreactor metagenome TaxID=1076179 RepID=A0A645FU88_9ZZZZ
MDQRHRARDYAERDKLVSILKRRAAQKRERGEKHRPAVERCALRDEHVRDRVDPADVVVDKVCRRLVKSRKYAREVGRVAERAIKKVRKAEAAADEKQHRRKHGLARCFEPALKKQVNAQQHRREREQGREYVGKAQRRAERIKRRGDAVAQKRVAHRNARHDRILRRERGLYRNARDEAQVHIHIAVG